MTPPGPTGSRRAALWTAAVLLVLTAVVYGAHVVRAEFLNFDDNLFFGADNQQFATGGLAHLLDPTQTIANVYLPVSHLSLWIDLQLGGASRWVHLHSVVLHGLAAFFFCRWLALLGLGPWAAGTAAVLFAVHPALVESAAWASSRKDVLSGLFAFLSLAAVARHTMHGGRRAAMLALLFGLLAMYSKATAVVLPALAAGTVLLAAPRGARRWGAVFGLLLLAGLVTGHTGLLAAQEGTMVARTALADRWPQVPGALCHYLGTAFWPVHLDVLYPEVKTLDAFREAAPLGLAALAALVATAALFLSVRGGRPVAAGLLLGLAALLPFNTVWPASSIAAADRYLYLVVPCLALAVAAVPRVGPALAAAAAVACLPLAMARTADFADSGALWRASLARDRDNAVALINLAKFEAQRHPENLKLQKQLFEEAVAAARYPRHAQIAHQYLRSLAVAEGRLPAAVHHARKEIKWAREIHRLRQVPESKRLLLQSLLDGFYPLHASGASSAALALLDDAESLGPDQPSVLAFRAVLLLNRVVRARVPVGDDHPTWLAAKALLDQALAGTPGHFEAHLVRGQWAQLMGHHLEALGHYQKAVAAGPFTPRGYVAFGRFYMAENMYLEAEHLLADALYHKRLKDPSLLHAYAQALIGRGELRRARTALVDYVKLRPRDRDARKVLAHVLAALAMAAMHQLEDSDLQERIAAVEAVSKEEPKLHLLRAHAARRGRNFGDEVVHLQRAVVAFPQDREIAGQLTRAHRDRGWQLKLQGDEEAALDQWRWALDTAPVGQDMGATVTMVEAAAHRHLDRGRRALAAGDDVRAEQELRRALFLTPEDPLALHALGRFLFAVGRNGEEAETLLAAAAAAGGAVAPESRLLHVLLLRARQAVTALPAARALLDQEGVDGPLETTLTVLHQGWNAWRTGDRDRALDLWRRALDAAPAGLALDSVHAMLDEEVARLRERGAAALERGVHRDAETVLRRARALLPGDPEVSYLLGLSLYARRGAPLEEALALFRSAGAVQRRRGRDPSLAVLYEVLTLKRLQRPEQARRAAAAVLDTPDRAPADIVARLRAAVGQ